MIYNFIEDLNKSIRYIRGIDHDFENDKDINEQCDKIYDIYKDIIDELEYALDMKIKKENRKDKSYSIVKLDDTVADIRGYILSNDIKDEDNLEELNYLKAEYIEHIDFLLYIVTH